MKSHFANWREWELNPIVIKELRQGVRSWTVTGMLMLFLVVMFIASIGFLISQSFDVNPDMQLGSSMFSTFMVILAVTSIFFIPLYTGVRVSSERQENNPDLLYVSTLSPSRIILGKFLCSAYIAILFFSACMPFMAFTNLLRGVDLPTVFFVLAFLFLVVCAANMIAIFLACLPVSRPFKLIFVLYGLFHCITTIFSLVAISFGLMRSGVGTMMAGEEFWIGTVTAVGVTAMVAGLFFALSVALISPPSANRALPLRIYVTVIWLIGGLLALAWVMQTGDAQRLYVWTVPTFILMVVALLVTISNNDQLSYRTRRKIPVPALKRHLAFIFFNGAAGGLIWVAAILGLTLLATKWLENVFTTSRSPYSEADAGTWLAATILYAFAYALTALFIHRRFFPRRASKVAGLIAVLLAAGWAILPSIVLFFANQLSWKSVDHLQLGNIFNVFILHDDSDRALHIVFAAAWVMIALLVNTRWFIRQFKNFQSPDAIAKPPVIAG